MTLTDAQVERYSRQIIVPEVGGRGQARIFAAHVRVSGTGAAARAAATLLGRAGVGTLDVDAGMPALDAPSPECRVARSAAPPPDVFVDLSGTPDALRAGAAGPHGAVVLGAARDADLAVLTLHRHPCVRCVAEASLAAVTGRGPTPEPAASALGALAAAEALRALLVGVEAARLTLLGLAGGEVAVRRVGAARACAACGPLT
jgi:molybdopterin/thiamine biosynthesis adenylyltransferase